MPASKFHRNLDQHVSVSKVFREELEETGQDIIKQISNLDQKTLDKILIKVINGIVRGIYRVIPNLQEIGIKSSIDNLNNDDLKDIVRKLSQDCNEMLQENDSNSSTLKPKFKIFIQNIILEAGRLLIIIKKDSLHDYKHELVQNLKDILYTIQIFQFRIKIENYNQQELKTIMKNIQEEYVKDISIIENCSLEVLKTVAIHSRFTSIYTFNVTHFLNTVASNYNDIEIQSKILEAARLMNSSISSFLINMEKTDNIKDAIAELTKVSLNCWDDARGLFDFIELCLEESKNLENLQDLAKMTVCYGFVINKQTGKNIKNDSLFA